MRTLCFLIALVSIQLVLRADHLEAQTNALIRSMLQSALVRANFDRQTQTVKGGPRYATSQQEFFEGNAEWSAEDKRASFDWYLRHLSSTAKSCGVTHGRVRSENPLACAAIAQCEIMGYTNAIPALYDNSRGVADQSRIMSVALLLKWCGICRSTVELVGDVVSNEVCYAVGERNAAYRMFCSKILGAGDPARYDSSHSAGEALMFARRADPVGAVAVDKLIVSTRTNYVNSVERYETACAVLANTNAMQNCLRYFAGVTNRLQGVSVNGIGD